MTEALHDVTFRILSMSEARRDVCPAHYNPVSGILSGAKSSEITSPVANRFCRTAR